jgi:hypothetical protein
MASTPNSVNAINRLRDTRQRIPAMPRIRRVNAVGGVVTMQATAQPPNGKAILTEGADGLTVNINGFAFTGATVRDGNGAGIRYEGGTLNVTDSHFYNNQDGILGAADPNGVISISNSEFDHNGTGDGRTHNMYIGDIASFTLTDSYTHDANVGHEIKSRAENNTITNNRILDLNSTSSYEIDLPNGGNAVISGNTIQQGVNSQNSNIIAYGEEGDLHAGTSLSVTGNTIINDLGRGVALWNAGGATATFGDNEVYGFAGGALVSGSATETGTTVLTSRPTLDTSAGDVTPVPTPVTAPAAVPVVSSGLVLNVSEDAYQGDAQYTIAVDGQQLGDLRTATAAHSSSQFEQISLGTLSPGQHQVAITFLNDKWDGTPQTDRNLFVNSATYNGQTVAGSSLALMSAGTQGFAVTGDVAPTPAPTITSTATINVSEDAYLGDAQFTIAVDGKQMGGTYTATALHSAGQAQAITLAGITENFTPHDIAVTFLNDAYAGTPSTDRNLYVNSIQFDGQAVSGGAATLMSAGTQHFTAIAPANWTG